MNTSQLQAALLSDPEIARLSLGVHPADKIPTGKEGCMIVNEDDSTKSGSHWIALFILPGRKVDYFDSYGRAKVVPALAKFLEPFHVTRSKVRVQNNLSTCCGQHCLFWLWLRCRDFTFAEAMACYSGNQSDNDAQAVEFVADRFGIAMEPVNTEFLWEQFSKALML